MFSLHFDFFILVISRFGFVDCYLVLIGSVPDRCILFTFRETMFENNGYVHV